MPSKLENPLPLFISVRKWVGLVLTSGLAFNFTQVKVKGRHASQSELYILKKFILTQKGHCEVSIIIAMNYIFKRAVFNIQHLNSNWEDFLAFILFFVLNCRNGCKIQCAHISKSYPTCTRLSHSVQLGINPHQKHSPPYILPSPLQIVQALLFR